MRVLITGAAGFLGSHLMLHHLKQGDTVMGIDNYTSSNRNSDHVKLIKLLCSTSHRSELFEGDIHESGESSLDSYVEEFQRERPGTGDFDLIYNFACPASPPVYQAMPILTMMTCVAGTAAVLALAQRHGARVVHASTSEVYGDPEHSPQKETYRGRVNSYGPRACYDEGKRAAEALCYDYLQAGTDARLVRIFNTYGPHMDPHDGRVVSNFICQALRGERLTIYGDGSQTRSFCYVDDLIRGIVAVGALPTNPLGPINLGNPNEFTVRELAELTLSRMGYKDIENRLNLRPLPTDDPTQRKPDITRAWELLGWQPEVQLAQGIDRTIDYFRTLVK